MMTEAAVSPAERRILGGSSPTTTHPALAHRRTRPDNALGIDFAKVFVGESGTEGAHRATNVLGLIGLM